MRRDLRSAFNPLRVAQRLWPPLLFLVILLALWELALAVEYVSETILPHPKDIVVSFYELITSSFVWDDIGATLWESVAGFVLGAVLGLALAIPSGLSPTMRQMLNPYAVALQVTPRIAIAPLIIAWAGFGYNSKIWIAAIIAFFPVYVNALTGMLTVDEDAREMFRSLGASKRQQFMQLMMPGSLPIMFAGLKTAAGLALVGAVVGEFISAERGLGVLVQQFSSQLAISDAFAVILMLMLLGLLLYGFMEWLERTTVFWLHDGRLVARSRRRAEKARAKAKRLASTRAERKTTVAG
ncbi:MAG TPA: ABC transporter permease [Solirubrobacteraceae bacterium]|nr:ABC transporter permease [Solirubrobacteraceae bacterium]